MSALKNKKAKRIKRNFLMSVCLFRSVRLLPITVSGLAKVAIFTTKFHTKNRTSNIGKTVIRSTEPPLLPNPCYAFVVLFGLGLFVCGYCCLGALAWWLFCFFLFGFVRLQKRKCATKSVGTL